MTAGIIVAIITAVGGIGAALITYLTRRRTQPLEISAVTVTDNSELDVKVRNTEESDALITRIQVTVLRVFGTQAEAILPPSAGYELPIHDLSRGQSRSVQVSQVVEQKGTDRFLVALHTRRRLRLKLTLTYNRDKTVSCKVST